MAGHKWTVYCPECGAIGSKKRGGYCHRHDPEDPKRNVCIQCGDVAFRRNDEYEGCNDDWYCKRHYEEKCGIYLGDARPDYKTPSLAPKCVQCGMPAWKDDKNGYPYCKTHWIARQDVKPRERSVFTDKYVDELPSDDVFIPDNFRMLDGKLGYER